MVLPGGALEKEFIFELLFRCIWYRIRVFCTGQALLLCFLPERYLNYDKSCVFRYRLVVL